MATAAKKAAPTAGKTQPATRARLMPDAQLPNMDVVGPDVKVNVPKGFRLTRDDGLVVEYLAGRQMMPEMDAKHFYAQANGVTIL